MSPSLLKFRRCFAVLQFRKYKMHTSCVPLRAPMTTTVSWCCCKSKKVFPCFLGLQMGCGTPRGFLVLGGHAQWPMSLPPLRPPSSAPLPLRSAKLGAGALLSTGWRSPASQPGATHWPTEVSMKGIMK